MISRAALGVWFRAALALALGFACPTSSGAQGPAPDRSRRPDLPAPDDLFEELGLESTDGCIAFREWKRLRIRKERWLDSLQRLASLQPDLVYGWIVGARRPPSRAVDEARQQRNCMLDALVRASLERKTAELEVDVPGPASGSKAADRRWLRGYFDSRSRRQRVRSEVTVSDYRSALSQARIWRRKYLFVGRPFNQISPEAADRCRLPAGTTWKPDHPHHTYCWNDILSGPEREREILSASSAPGLSRHHWGTEFDLFSLSPGDFRPGRIHHDEYRWLQDNAPGFGFFQSYRPHSAIYMAERWHWSYYPIAQALTEFASNHRDLVADHLERLWDRLERRFNGEAPEPTDYFDYIRREWPPYMFDVFVPNFEAQNDSRHEPFQ